FPATVAPFLLDRYEVTVGRLRRFVQSYPASRPAEGAGADGSAPGWGRDWPLPPGQAELRADLRSCADATWTDAEGAREERPATCGSWYVAKAFCLWDGGRLPSEAEWNFAAAGGAEQRVYPFSTPPPISDRISPEEAVFGAAAPQPVGSRSPRGDGR